jgi:hypothetical protein
MTARTHGFGAATRVVATALVALASIASPAGAQDAPTGQDPIVERCQAPEHRQFDFWLGRWEVRNPDGDVVGHNEIARVAGGCGLLERWRGARGSTGVSVNAYDPDLGRWTQRWVGDGATLWLEGGLEEGLERPQGPEGPRPMVLSGTAPRATPRGQVLDRISWTPLPDGRVRQVWEVSDDGGATWREIFVGLYSEELAREPR